MPPSPPPIYITLRRSKQPTTERRGGTTTVATAAYNWDNESHRSVSLLEIVSRRPPPVNSLLGAYCTYTKHPRPSFPPPPSWHLLFARTNCANFRVSLEVVDIGVDTISLDCKHSRTSGLCGGSVWPTVNRFSTRIISPGKSIELYDDVEWYGKLWQLYEISSLYSKGDIAVNTSWELGSRWNRFLFSLLIEEREGDIARFCKETTVEHWLWEGR